VVGCHLLISKGLGSFSYEMYNTARETEGWEGFQYTTLEGGFIEEDEIAQAKREMDEKTFQQEYEASFITYSGAVYYNWNREKNVVPCNDKFSTADIFCGIDFNVSPCTAVIAIRQGDNLYVIDEIRLYSSNTHELAAEIHSRYPTSKKFAYPDPAGSQRKTSAGGLTDHTILANNQFTVKSPRSHTPVRDRINAVNSRFCSAAGIRQLFISPRCKYTIESLEKHTYRQDSVQPDKDSGWDHLTDALGYMVDYLFPIRRDMEPQRAQRWGHRIQG